MKKILFSIICVLLIGVLVFVSFFKKEDNQELTKIKVAEVTHSIFYAPQYLAKALGYFEDEGLDVEIGFCGSEATIYVYNNGEKDYLVNFAAVTKRDGSFLVSRTKMENFKLEDLKGKHIIAGRKAGMPAMTLEYALNKNGVSSDEVNLDTSIDFASTIGAFIGGTGDFVSVFEPSALSLEKQGAGYVVASIGELGGEVPYTVYNARKSFIEANPEIIKGFSKAIDKALAYVHGHTAEEVAKAIVDYFPDNTINDITTVVQRYMDIDAWFENTYISEENFNHIQEIIENSNELTNRAPYDKLVNNQRSK